MDIQKRFGMRIKDLRKKTGLTQEQLAEKINMEPKQICRIETGVCFTTLENIQKIARTLNVSLEEIFSVEHKDSRENLLEQIDKIISSASDKELQIVFRILKDIIH